MLQPRLNIKLAQRQVLTPGLVQMVSVLALNKLELKEMIDGELVENPVLEEVEESTETMDQRSAREGDRERSAEQTRSRPTGRRLIPSKRSTSGATSRTTWTWLSDRQ